MAEEKKVTRSSKMYKDSPHLERKEGGKLGVAKKKAEHGAGKDGHDGHVPEHEKAAMEMAQKHEKERLDLHHKHEKEHHALSSKHMVEEDKNQGAALTEEQEKEGGEGQA